MSEEESALVRQIDIATGDALMTISTGPETEGVKVMPDGETINFTSEAADMVHVVDAREGRVVRNIPFTHAVELTRFAAHGRLAPVSLAVITGVALAAFLAAVAGYDPARSLLRPRRPAR